MKGKRRSKGILTSIRDAPQKKPKKTRRSSSPILVGLKWIGFGVAAVVFVAVMWSYGQRMYNPEMGAWTNAGKVAVREVISDTGGFPPEAQAVAVAVIAVEGRFVRVPLRQEHENRVEEGTLLHVEYTFFPRTGVVQVDDWEILPDPPEAEEDERESRTGGQG
jgi:hypothetical protein